MADALFEDPRLADIYDELDTPGRPDLDAYEAMAAEFGAKRIVDLGCGTGTLALRLAASGRRVIGVDPAAASLAVARRKAHADRVRWILGTARDLPAVGADLLTMTGNVAQVFLTDGEWFAALRACRDALRTGGRLVFETRDPARRGWRAWTRERSLQRVDIAGTGPVERWHELTAVDPPLVSFRTTVAMHAQGVVLTSDSTLRFRTRAEITSALADVGFAVDEVRDAPDRPGLEFVFVARRLG